MTVTQTRLEREGWPRLKGGAMTAAQIEASGPSEVDEVQRWRFDVLVRAGYDLDDALELAARRDVDLHLATDLVRQGCPSATAARIVL